jgi:hypothetical protein
VQGAECGPEGAGQAQSKMVGPAYLDDETDIHQDADHNDPDQQRYGHV